MLQRIEQENINQNSLERKRFASRAQYKRRLEEDMAVHKVNEVKTHEQKAAERQAIDQRMRKLAEEEINNLQKEGAKKNQFFQVMQETLQDKFERLQKDQLEKTEAERKAMSEMERQEIRGKEWKETRLASDARKDEIYNRMKEEKEAQILKQKEIEALVAELRREETREADRHYKRKAGEKAAKFKTEMKRFEQEDQKLKAEKLAEEKKKEIEFKERLVREFAESERLDQMNAQKRRVREAQHKREVDALWAEKQARLEEERRAKEAGWEIMAAERQFAEEVVRAEKRRLLEEHLPFIQDHCAPEVWAEARRLAGNASLQ